MGKSSVLFMVDDLVGKFESVAPVFFLVLSI